MTNEQLCSLAREEDKAAETTLIENVLPSIRINAANIQKRYFGILLETDDLVQEALIGVLRAIKTYDPETGNLFLTYAQTTAENAMLDYVRKCASTLPAAFSVLTLRRRDLIPKQMSLMQISSRTITLKILSSSLSEKRPLQKSEMPLEKSLIVNGPISITALVFSIMFFMIKAKPQRIFISA